MKLLKIGQVALHCNVNSGVRRFGTENNTPHVQHSAFHLLTCNGPERILSKVVVATNPLIWWKQMQELKLGGAFLTVFGGFLTCVSPNSRR